MGNEGRGVQATVGRDDCKRLASWLKLAMSDKDSRALVNDFLSRLKKDHLICNARCWTGRCHAASKGS